MSTDHHQDRNEASAGITFALLTYGMWGFFPLYWKQLADVPATQILAHRMVWSLLFVGGILLAKRKLRWIREVLRTPRVLLTYFSAASLLALNWGVYIWAVNAGYVVETALGYFINPLINVLFGAMLLGERARQGQWMAIAIATAGVLYLTWSYGQPPIIALTLAISFGTYGLFKKKGTLGALEGLSLETGLLFLPALCFLGYTAATSGVVFGADAPVKTNALLMLSGVATALPLLTFAAALRRLTLTVVGFIQYMAPSIQFLLGVFLYNEPFDTDKLIGFSLIWAALVVFTIEGVIQRRKNQVTRAD